MSEKVNREVAISEVNKWLDHKRVNEKKRESKENHIEAMADAIEEGELILNDDFTFTQKLKFPVGEEKKVSELVYKPRVAIGTFMLHLQGVKSDDAEGRLCAYIAGLTSNSKEIIKKLDPEDFGIGQSIAFFFL